MFQVSLKVTTKQNPIVDACKIKRRKSKCTTPKKSSIHKGRQQERKKNKRPTKQPENN